MGETENPGRPNGTPAPNGRSGPKQRAKELENRIGIYARIPAAVLEHQMDRPPAGHQGPWRSIIPEHERVYSCVLRFSWCWPICMDFAVLTNEADDILRNPDGSPLPLSRPRIAQLLGMRRQNVFRALAILQTIGLLRIEAGRIYPVIRPETAKLVHLGDLSTDDNLSRSNGQYSPSLPLPIVARFQTIFNQIEAPPELRTETLERAKAARTRFLEALKRIRTEEKNAYKELCTELAGGPHHYLVSESEFIRSGGGDSEQPGPGEKDGVPITGEHVEPSSVRTPNQPNQPPPPPLPPQPKATPVPDEPDQGRKTPPVEKEGTEVATVTRAIRTIRPTASADDAEMLIAECRRRAPDATAAEILQTVDSLAERARNEAENVVSWLLAVAPRKLAATLLEMRAGPPGVAPGSGTAQASEAPMSRYEMANELLTLREALKTSQIDPSDPEHAPWEKELAKKFHSQEAEIRAQIAALEMAIEHGPPTTRADLATVAQLTRRAKGDTAAD